MELEISWKSFILDANKDGVDQELFWESSTDQQGRSMYAHKISKAALQQGRELFSRLNLNIYISRHSGKRIRLDKYDELLAVAVHSGLNKEKLLLDLEDPNLIKEIRIDHEESPKISPKKKVRTKKNGSKKSSQKNVNLRNRHLSYRSNKELILSKYRVKEPILEERAENTPAPK